MPGLASPHARLRARGVPHTAAQVVVRAVAIAAAFAGIAGGSWAADAPTPVPVPALVVRTPSGQVPGGAGVVVVRPLPVLASDEAPRPVVDEDGPTVAVFDAEGRLVSLPPGPGGSFVVRRIGSVLTPLPERIGGATLVLPDARPLVGRVLREGEDAPAADLSADLEILAFPDADGSDPYVRRARVAPDGGFRFDTLGDGTRVRLVARRRAGAWSDLGEVHVGEERIERRLPRGAAVLGRVLDVDRGGGVEGLTLRLRPLVARGDALDPRTAVPATAGDPTVRSMVHAVLGEVRTVEGGRFRLADLPIGRYEVELVTSDGTPSMVWVWDGDPPRIDVGDLVRRGATTQRMGSWWVRPRGAIVGRLVDHRAQAPVVGALVIALPAPDLVPVPGGAVVGPPATSDATGAFRVVGLAPAAGWRLLVTAPDRSPMVTEAIDVAGGRDEPAGTLRMVGSWHAEIRVVDAMGQPIAGVRVVGTPMARPVGLLPDGAVLKDGDAEAVVRALVRVATSDEDGRALLRDLADDDLHVVASGPGVVATAVVVAVAAPGTPQRATLVVARTVALTGRIEARDGTLPKVVVRVTQRDDPHRPGGVLARVGGEVLSATREAARTAIPDESGRFRIEDLPPIPLDVEVTDPSGSFVFVRAEAVTPGGPDDLVLAVRATRSIEGVVLGLVRDAPAATVVLEGHRYDDLRDAYRPVRIAAATLPTDVDHSTFVFRDVPPGFYAVRALQAGRDSGATPATVDDRDVLHVELRLPAPSEVEGVVVDERILASAFGATVRLVRIQGRSPAPGLASRSTTTDAYGRFQFQDVTNGRYRVEVADRDAVGREVEVLVGSGERVRVEGLALTSGGRIAGRVEDEGGRRVAGLPIRVWRRPDLHDVTPMVTNGDGTFRSVALAAGRYRLFVTPGLSGRPGIDADVEVVEGETTEVAFGPSGGGRVEGVVERRGQPVAGVALELVTRRNPAVGASGYDELALSTVSDAYGAFAWDGLPEGRYVLRVVDGSARSGWPVVLAHNDRVRRELELGEGEIRGVVRTVRGDPVGGADVRALHFTTGAVTGRRDGDELATYGRARTGPDGQFALVGLPVGRYRVFVSPAHGSTRTIDGVFAEPLGQASELEVLVGGGGRLELRVIDDRGRPVASTEVWVERPDGGALHPRAYHTGTSGRLTIEGLPDGPAQVRVLSRGHGRPQPSPIVIRDESTTSLDIVVQPAGKVRLSVAAGHDLLSLARVEVRRGAGREVVLPRQGLRSPDESTSWITTGRRGFVELEDLEPGQYFITVSAASVWIPQTVEVYVEARRTTEVGVTLLPR